MDGVFDWIMLIVMILGLGAVLVIGIIAIISWGRENTPKKKPAPKPRKQPVEEQEYVPKLEEIYATVESTSCQVKMVGFKVPKTVQIYTVAFRTRDHKLLTFQVPEEMYHGLEEGQQGMLTYVDQNLYGFELE